MERLKKAQKLRPANLLAAAFLLYIGFVALYSLEPLKNDT